MKLSKQTLEVLKNFSGINQNLYVKPGSVLRTMTTVKNVLASVEVAEVFPQEFGIYNLNEFLGVLSLFDDPDLSFDEKNLVITQGKNSVTYYYAAKDVLVTPEKDIKMPSVDVTFTLTKEVLSSLQKAASVLKVAELVVSGSDGVVSVTVSDTKNATANKYSVDVGTTDATFTAVFNIDNLKLINGDYDVEISSKKISKFTNSAMNYTAFIALEMSSKFD